MNDKVALDDLMRATEMLNAADVPVKDRMFDVANNSRDIFDRTIDIVAGSSERENGHWWAMMASLWRTARTDLKPLVISKVMKICCKGNSTDGLTVRGLGPYPDAESMRAAIILKLETTDWVTEE